MKCNDCGISDKNAVIFPVFDFPFSVGAPARVRKCRRCWTGGELLLQKTERVMAPPKPDPKPDPEKIDRELIGACVHGGQDDGCDSCAEAVRQDNDNWETTY